MDDRKEELITESEPNAMGRLLQVLGVIALVGGVLYGLFAISQWTMDGWFGISILETPETTEIVLFILWMIIMSIPTLLGFLTMNWFVATLGWLVWVPVKYVFTAECPEYPFDNDDAFFQPTEALFDNAVVDTAAWCFLCVFGNWRPAWQDELRLREEKRREQDPDYQAAWREIEKGV